MKPPTKAQLAEATSRVADADAAYIAAEAALAAARTARMEAKAHAEHLQRLVQLAKWPEEVRAALLADPATWSEEDMMKLHRRGLAATDRRWDGAAMPKRALNISGGMFRDSLRRENA